MNILAKKTRKDASQDRLSLCPADATLVAAAIAGQTSTLASSSEPQSGLAKDEASLEQLLRKTSLKELDQMSQNKAQLKNTVEQTQEEIDDLKKRLLKKEKGLADLLEQEQDLEAKHTLLSNSINKEKDVVNPPYQKPEETDRDQLHDFKELIMSEDGNEVLGGPINKLVEMLTHESWVNTAYSIAFLLTYQSFTTSHGLMDQLFQRFGTEKLIWLPSTSSSSGSSPSSPHPKPSTSNAPYASSISISTPAGVSPHYDLASPEAPRAIDRVKSDTQKRWSVGPSSWSLGHVPSALALSGSPLANPATGSPTSIEGGTPTPETPKAAPTNLNLGYTAASPSTSNPDGPKFLRSTRSETTRGSLTSLVQKDKEKNEQDTIKSDNSTSTSTSASTSTSTSTWLNSKRGSNPNPSPSSPSLASVPAPTPTPAPAPAPAPTPTLAPALVPVPIPTTPVLSPVNTTQGSATQQAANNNLSAFPTRPPPQPPGERHLRDWKKEGLKSRDSPVSNIIQNLNSNSPSPQTAVVRPLANQIYKNSAHSTNSMSTVPAPLKDSPRKNTSLPQTPVNSPPVSHNPSSPSLSLSKGSPQSSATSSTSTSTSTATATATATATPSPSSTPTATATLTPAPTATATPTPTPTSTPTPTPTPTPAPTTTTSKSSAPTSAQTLTPDAAPTQKPEPAQAATTTTTNDEEVNSNPLSSSSELEEDESLGNPKEKSNLLSHTNITFCSTTPPTYATVRDQLTAEHERLNRIRLRVFTVIQQWVDNYWDTFAREPALIYRLIGWIDSTLEVVGMSNHSKKLRNLLKKKLEGATTKRQAIIEESKIPPPILPKDTDPQNFTFMELDLTEIARQICLMDQKIYQSLTLREFLNQSWNKSQRDLIAPNITACIKNFNEFSEWVATVIVQEISKKRRTKVLERFILLAAKFRELNNFSSLMAILSGLEATSVYRLHKTWESLDEKILATFKELKTRMSSDHNFHLYREDLHTANPPCVPYLGTYLTDLTFIEDGKSDTIKDKDNIINFSKRKQLANLIREIETYQNTPYPFKAVPSIQSFLQTLFTFRKEEEACYTISMAIEPSKEMMKSYRI